jgi:hypothetical protein
LLTTINTGSIGVAPGTTITGLRQVVSGQEEINTPIANQCTDDLLSAFGVTQGATPTNTLASSDLAGKTECHYSISCLLYWTESNPISS